MKLLMMGPQGSGKGTTGGMLSEYFHIPLIASGDLLRSLPESHPRYQEIHKLIDAGELAPQDFVAELFKARISQPDCSKGFIIDGWGRKTVDLAFFDPNFDKVILLNITPETSVYRLSGRRTCKKCGRIFNINTVPSKVAGICDVCGGELYQREDDTEESIRRRLNIYYSDTQEVIESLRQKGILVEIDAEPAPEIVFNRVLASLNLK
jgi:adenylate kinase